MRRTVPVLAALVLVVGSLAVAPASAHLVGNEPTVTQAATPETATDTETTADANESGVAPGARLAGVFGVQEAELDGEIESRAFGVAVARARTNESKAAVVARQVRESDDRLAELAERRERLETARENGAISDDRYRARVARLAAETETVERLMNRTESETRSLPADALERNGVNATTIRTVRTRASELSGPEMKEIAHTIAGPGVGRGLAADERGPPEHVEPGPDGNETRQGDGHGSGPPNDAGGNGAGPQSDHDGNGSGPPSDTGSNGSGPPSDAGDPGRERGPPNNASNGPEAPPKTTSDDDPSTETETEMPGGTGGGPPDPDDRGADGDRGNGNGNGNGNAGGSGNATG